MTPICSPRAAPLVAVLAPLLLCNEKVFVVIERGVDCQGNYNLPCFWKREKMLLWALLYPRGSGVSGECLSSKVSHKFPQSRGGGVGGSLMHLHSTLFLITKWPGTIYVALCFFFPLPHWLLLENASLPPAPRFPAGWRMASAVDKQSQQKHLVAFLLSLLGN